MTRVVTLKTSGLEESVAVAARVAGEARLLKTKSDGYLDPSFLENNALSSNYVTVNGLSQTIDGAKTFRGYLHFTRISSSLTFTFNHNASDKLELTVDNGFVSGSLAKFSFSNVEFPLGLTAPQITGNAVQQSATDTTAGRIALAQHAALKGAANTFTANQTINGRLEISEQGGDANAIRIRERSSGFGARVAWLNDANSPVAAIAKDNADSITFYTDGDFSTPKAVINSSGNIGAGTASPDTRLHALGGAGIIALKAENTDAAGANSYAQFVAETTVGSLFVGATGPGRTTGAGTVYHGNEAYVATDSSLEALNIAAANAAGVIKFYTGGTGASAESMRIDASGNVAIGEASPTEKLQVNGSVFAFNFYVGKVAATAGTVGFPFGSTNGPQLVFWGKSAAGGDGVQINTASVSNALRVKENGNVGIGTATPSSILHVKGSGNQYIRLETSSSAAEVGMLFGAAGDDTRAGVIYNEPNKALQIRGFDNDVAISIDSSGNIGAGTTSPSAKIDVDDGAFISARFGDSDNDAGSWARAGIAFYKGTSGGINDFVRMGLLGSGDNLTRFWLSVDPNTSSPWNNAAVNVDATGNVGIGALAPLSFSGYKTLTIRAESNGANLEFQHNSGSRGGFVVYQPGVKLEIGAPTSAGSDIDLVFNPPRSIKHNKVLVQSAIVSKGNLGTSATIDWRDGNIQEANVNNNTTLSFTNPPGPCRLQLTLTNTSATNTITLPGSVAEVYGAQSSVNGATYVLSLVYDGTDYLASYVT